MAGTGLRALNHIGFAVKDLDRSVEFYNALLGTEPYFNEVYDRIPYIGKATGYPGASQRAAFYDLPGPDQAFLELIEYLHPEPQLVPMEAYCVGNAHICLASEDIDAEYERLRSIEGISFRSDGPVSSDYGVYTGAKGFFIRDPDGITIQFVEIPKGVDPQGRSEAAN